MIRTRWRFHGMISYVISSDCAWNADHGPNAATFYCGELVVSGGTRQDFVPSPHQLVLELLIKYFL